MATTTSRNSAGILLVDKPAGPTSQDVVSIVKRALFPGPEAKNAKAGHTGTLDPFATGLLIVCLGRATKLAAYLTGEEKAYRATAALGVRTDTDDATGKELARADASALDRGAVEKALAAFRGAIRQVPPAYSAIQKDGERMYDKARRGEAVEIEARDVFVRTLDLVEFSAGPVATAVLDMLVSKGTYVRSIARDLGAALGVGGHLTALRRTASGGYSAADAISLDQVKASPDAAWTKVIPIDRVMLPLPAFEVSGAAAARIPDGILPPGIKDLAPGVHRLVDAEGLLLAIVEVVGGTARFQQVLASR